MKFLQLLIGTSLFAQIFGSWIAFTIMAFLEEGEGGIWSAALGSTFMMIFGMPMILGVWFVVTLPLSAICLHFKINANYLLMTAVGIFVGVLLVNISVIPEGGMWRFTFVSVLFGTINGGFTAAGFWFLSRVWGERLPTD